MPEAEASTSDSAAVITAAAPSAENDDTEAPKATRKRRPVSIVRQLSGRSSDDGETVRGCGALCERLIKTGVLQTFFKDIIIVVLYITLGVVVYSLTQARSVSCDEAFQHLYGTTVSEQPHVFNSTQVYIEAPAGAPADTIAFTFGGVGWSLQARINTTFYTSLKELAEQACSASFCYLVTYQTVASGSEQLVCDRKWSIVDSLYFTMATMSTVGYGDLSPMAEAGSHVFTILYIVGGLIIAFPRLSTAVQLAGAPFFGACRTTIERYFPQKLIDLDGNGEPDFAVPRHPAVYYGKGLLGPVILFFIIQFVFAFAFTRCEGYDYGTTFYHSMVTATTVGYGDVSLTTDAGKLTATFHMLISVSMLAALLSEFDNLRTKRVADVKRSKQFLEKLNIDLIMSLDIDGSGVDKFEFVVGMLTRLEYVEPKDVQQFVAQFDSLDESGDGIITKEELQKYAQAQQEFANDPTRFAQVRQMEKNLKRPSFIAKEEKAGSPGGRGSVVDGAKKLLRARTLGNEMARAASDAIEGTVYATRQVGSDVVGAVTSTASSAAATIGIDQIQLGGSRTGNATTIPAKKAVVVQSDPEQGAPSGEAALFQNVAEEVEKALEVRERTTLGVLR